jgi:beta-glucanase (GH16 family)
MERLNGDDFVHHNVHSYYTGNLKQREPKTNAVAPINNGEFNVYGLEMYPDSIVWRVNGNRALCYPRIETDLDGQFPFDKPFYLLIDMQLGGSWVGEVNPNDLPVEMYIDWVRFYEWK